MGLNQQIFNTVVTHLRTQGRPAKGPQGCMYRTDFGEMCAVGCLIKDDYYHKNLEGEGASCDYVIQAVAKSLSVPIKDIDYRFLESLQATHDEFHPDRWEEQFNKVAEGYNLSIPKQRL